MRHFSDVQIMRLLGLELPDQIIVSVGSVVGDHFQRLARTPKHRRNNPLIEQVLRLLGMILDERFDLVMLEVDAESWNTNGHTHIAFLF